MIVNDNDRRVEVVASGATATFSYDFAVLDAGDIRGFWNGVEQFNFSVAGAGNDAGGSVTFLSTPVAGTVVVLLGGQDITAPSRYETVETLPLTQIENDFARAAITSQQLREELARSVKFSVGSTKRNVSVGEPIAGQYLRFKDSDGNIESSVVAVTSGTVSLPLAVAQGGTGVAAASNSELAQALGLARWAAGSSLTAAATLALPNPMTGNLYTVSGSTAISAISTTGIASGTVIVLRFSNTPQLTHGVSLQLQGAVNHVVVANEMITFELVGTVWYEVNRVYPASTSDTTKFLRGDGTWQTPAIEGRSSQLRFVSTTQIKLFAYNGNRVPVKTAVGWAMRDIGTGITSSNPTAASNYVNGAASQVLGASAIYDVYVFDNSGTLTFDFCTPGNHSPDPVTGIEILTGNDTHTLVGKVRLSASALFVDFHVISWFNKRRRGQTTNFSSSKSVSSGAYGEVDAEIRNQFLVWANDVVSIFASGGVGNDTVSATVNSAINIDGTVEDVWNRYLQATGSGGALGLSLVKTGLSEGLHYASLSGSVSSGLGTWYGGSFGLRTTLAVMIEG